MAEAKYIAIAYFCTQILWMKKALKDVNIETKKTNHHLLYNTSVISLSKSLVMHWKTKHIPIKYHFLHEQVVEQNIMLE